MSVHPNEDYKLRDIAAVFIRWRTLALAAFLSILIPGVLVTLLMPPMYEASAVLLVDRPTLSPTYSVKPGQGVESVPFLRSVSREEEVKTVAETIRTRALVESTVDALGIDKASLNRIRDFRRKVQAAVDWVIDGARWLYDETKYAIGFTTRPTAEEQAFTKREALLDEVGNRLRVAPVPDTNILRASFRSSDPALAQAAINNIVTEFVGRQQRRGQSSQAHFAEELRQVAEELRAAESELAEFRGKMSSYSITTQRDLLLQSVEQLRGELSQIEARRAQKHAAVQELRGRQWADPRMQREIGKNLLEAEVELAGLTAQSGVLRNAVAERQKELANINTASVRLRELERDVARSEEAFALRQRNFEQARVTESMAEAKLRDVRVVDLAAYPLMPIRPRTLLYLGIVLCAAALAAIAMPFVAQLNDTTLESEHDALRLLGLPFVASVPHVARLSSRAAALLPRPARSAE